MSKRAILAATAILAGSFNPVFSTQAWAAVTFPDGTPPPTGPTQDTKDAMQDQCDALALAHGFNWTGTLDEGSIGAGVYVSGPTEVGTHTIADAIEGTLEGAGTFTPAHLEFTSDPYRNGGSVNMWANADAVGGQYSASEYDFEGDFETKYTYAFDCDMTETVISGAEGFYEVAGDFGDSEDAIRANCDAFTALGDNDPRPKWWGEPFHGGSPSNPHCRFVGTPGTEEEEDRDPESGIPVEETQTDTLIAHEDAGEGFFDSATVSIGKVLVCISPTTSTQTKKGAPGTWVFKHGYSGEKCTTTWYNTGAMVDVANLNTGSNNVVTVPVILP
jgi:hypothetical protein